MGCPRAPRVTDSSLKQKDIIVVGGGDSAVEEALFLARFGDTVTVVHRRKELRASKIMQDRAFANDRISFRWNSVVEEVLGDSKVSAVQVRDVDDRRDRRDPRPLASSWRSVTYRTRPSLTGQLDLDENGYIRTNGGTTTNVDGVFACGDVQDHYYRQAVTAAGSGCMAAIDAERWLEANKRVRDDCGIDPARLMDAWLMNPRAE